MCYHCGFHSGIKKSLFWACLNSFHLICLSRYSLDLLSAGSSSNQAFLLQVDEGFRRVRDPPLRRSCVLWHGMDTPHQRGQLSSLQLCLTQAQSYVSPGILWNVVYVRRTLTTADIDWEYRTNCSVCDGGGVQVLKNVWVMCLSTFLIIILCFVFRVSSWRRITTLFTTISSFLCKSRRMSLSAFFFLKKNCPAKEQRSSSSPALVTNSGWACEGIIWWASA